MLPISYVPVEGRCQRCGKAFQKYSANAKYCEPCRPLKAREYMKKAAKKRKQK